MYFVCRCYSWKYPDQLATDVHIKEILERYQYSKNELDNQVAHVILFEILIDRSVYAHLIVIRILTFPLDYYSFFTVPGDIFMILKRNSFHICLIPHRQSTNRLVSVSD